MNQFGFADLKNETIIDTNSMVITNLNLPNLDPNSVTYIDSINNLSDIVLNNGQLVIGRTGSAPVGASLTGTVNQVTVTNGPGSVTLSLPQDISPTSSPTFDNLTATTINGITVSNIVSDTGSAVAGNIASYVSSKVIQDSGISAASISGGPFLPLSGGIMTGDIGMGTHEISNLSAIRCRTDTRNFVAGNGAVVTSGIDSVVIGSSTILNGDNQ